MEELEARKDKKDTKKKSFNNYEQREYPKEFLDSLYINEEVRAQNSYNNFNKKENHQYVLEINNEVVGFIKVGKSNVTEYDNCGEIYALYIINKYKGYGFGKKLIEAGIKELKLMNFDKMVIKII